MQNVPPTESSATEPAQGAVAWSISFAPSRGKGKGATKKEKAAITGHAKPKSATPSDSGADEPADPNSAFCGEFYISEGIDMPMQQSDPDKGLLMVGAIAGGLVFLVLIAVFFGAV